MGTGGVVSQEASLPKKILPRLKNYSEKGERLDQVEFHPAYHELMQKTLGRVFMGAFGKNPFRKGLFGSGLCPLHDGPGGVRSYMPHHYDPGTGSTAPLYASMAGYGYGGYMLRVWLLLWRVWVRLRVRVWGI